MAVSNGGDTHGGDNLRLHSEHVVDVLAELHGLNYVGIP